MKNIPYEKFTECQKEKWLFTINHLFKIVKAIDKEYLCCIYIVLENQDEIMICSKAENNIKVNVTGDSIPSMAIDVLKKLFY